MKQTKFFTQSIRLFYLWLSVTSLGLLYPYKAVAQNLNSDHQPSSPPQSSVFFPRTQFSFPETNKNPGFIHRPLRFTLPEWPDNLEAPRGRRRGGASRNPIPPAALRLTALAIDDTPAGNYEGARGLTISSHPTFWFYIPYLPNEYATQIEFVLEKEDCHLDDDCSIYEATFNESTFNNIDSISGVVGIYPVDLSALEVGQSYRWYLNFWIDPNNPSAHVEVKGIVQRITPSADLLHRLDSTITKREQAVIYAENGIWHEAISTLAEILMSNSGNLSVISDWYSLLDSIGLDDIASPPVSLLHVTQNSDVSISLSN